MAGPIGREFRLSDAHPAKARAALAERILAERRQSMPFRPRLASRAGRDDWLLSEPGAGRGARISRLAQPRTQLWAACAHFCRVPDVGLVRHCSHELNRAGALVAAHLIGRHDQPSVGIATPGAPNGEV